MIPKAQATAVLTLALAVAAVGCGPSRPSARTTVVETRPLAVDRLYPSMTGPSDRLPVDFEQLDWVRAFRTEVLDVDENRPLGEEFFCHAQFQLPDAYRPMVTATGISEIRFPEGFALPLSRIVADYRRVFDPGGLNEPQPLTFFGMVLNNHETDIDVRAKVRGTIEYWTDEDLGERRRPKPLFRATLPMTVEDLAAYEPEGANPDVATHCSLVGGQNNHWLVPPGRQKTRKRYSNFLSSDTTVHYGVVHLHNYAVYMRLTDVTTGEVLWQTEAEHERERVQLARIPIYSSTDGFRLLRDHVYEIEAVYDNSTDAPVDAMAMMSLYHHPDRLPDGFDG